MIKEDYVSFEIAKLLKEKGFDWECDYIFYNYVEAYGSWEFEPLDESRFDNTKMISCPTQQMAMKWLREEKHYYIQVMLDNWVGVHCGYYVLIMKTDSDFGLQLYDEEEQVFYETPEQACEAAIKYCLENLI